MDLGHLGEIPCGQLWDEPRTRSLWRRLESDRLEAGTPGTDGLADGSTTRGRAGPEATAALPIPAALLPAAAHEGHPGALQTRCQAEFPSSFR